MRVLRTQLSHWRGRNLELGARVNRQNEGRHEQKLGVVTGTIRQLFQCQQRGSHKRVDDGGQRVAVVFSSQQDIDHGSLHCFQGRHALCKSPIDWNRRQWRAFECHYCSTFVDLGWQSSLSTVVENSIVEQLPGLVWY